MSTTDDWLSTVTVHLEPTIEMKVTLQIGSQIPIQISDEPMRVVAGIKQFLKGDPGNTGPPGGTIPRTVVLVTTPVLTPDMDVVDELVISGQATDIMVANPVAVGAHAHGRKLLIAIRDNGAARAVSFGSAYRGFAAPLPTTTVIGKTMYLGLRYNALDAKWDLMAFANQL